MQVILGNVVIDAMQATLEDAEVALYRVGRRVTARIFACRVIHNLMTRNAFLVAEVSLIGLNRLSSTAELTFGSVSHSEADTVKHKQAGLVGQSGLAVNLKGAHAFLGGGGAPESKAPVLEGNCAVLKDGALTHGVLPFAIAAAPADEGKVFVVIGGWDYEGYSDPTGVYSTKEAAELAKQHAANRENHSYDNLDILEYDLNFGEREIALAEAPRPDATPDSQG